MNDAYITTSREEESVSNIISYLNPYESGGKGKLINMILDDSKLTCFDKFEIKEN